MCVNWVRWCEFLLWLLWIIAFEMKATLQHAFASDVARWYFHILRVFAGRNRSELFTNYKTRNIETSVEMNCFAGKFFELWLTLVITLYSLPFLCTADDSMTCKRFLLLSNSCIIMNCDLICSQDIGPRQSIRNRSSLQPSAKLQIRIPTRTLQADRCALRTRRHAHAVAGTRLR